MVVELHNWFMCWYLEIDRESSYGVKYWSQLKTRALLVGFSASNLIVLQMHKIYFRCLHYLATLTNITLHQLNLG